MTNARGVTIVLYFRTLFGNRRNTSVGNVFTHEHNERSHQWHAQKE